MSSNNKSRNIISGRVRSAPSTGRSNIGDVKPSLFAEPNMVLINKFYMDFFLKLQLSLFRVTYLIVAKITTKNVNYWIQYYKKEKFKRIITTLLRGTKSTVMWYCIQI